MATRDINETALDDNGQTNANATHCPECDGRVTTDAIETVCEDCGLVIDEQQIDHGPEWRAYDDDQCDRTGAPLTVARHDRGLSTTIGRGTDANGNALSGRKRQQVARLRREQTRGRFQSKAERNLAHGLGEIRRISSALGLSATIRDQACQLFRSAQNEDLLRGRSIEAMAGASVYGACRCAGLSRTLDEVADAARVNQSSVTNTYKTLNTELGLPAQLMTPRSFIPRLAAELALSDHMRQRALELAAQAETTTLSNGCQPTGVAAACVYKAAREHGLYLSQSTVAEVVDTTPTTLRLRRNELEDLVDSDREHTHSRSQR